MLVIWSIPRIHIIQMSHDNYTSHFVTALLSLKKIKLVGRYFQWLHLFLCQALVVAPTRELAQQIKSVAVEYGRLLGIKCCCLFGGQSKNVQSNYLSEGECLCATKHLVCWAILAHHVSVNGL